ncbi:MAG: hypothetical protein JXQ75_16490, partial [Phycisphaerae bacterium]|nr:hypothetical protein [Phycisphaerae bacterium]
TRGHTHWQASCQWHPPKLSRTPGVILCEAMGTRYVRIGRRDGAAIPADGEKVQPFAASGPRRAKMQTGRMCPGHGPGLSPQASVRKLPMTITLALSNWGAVKLGRCQAGALPSWGAANRQHVADQYLVVGQYHVADQYCDGRFVRARTREGAGMGHRRQDLHLCHHLGGATK